MKIHLLPAAALFTVVVLNHQVYAQCSPAGTKAPTAVVNDQSLALGLVPISSLGSANVSDDSYAEAAAVTLGDTTQYLFSHDYEFNIPSNATICGIEVFVERSATGLLHEVKDFAVELSKGGTIGGDNKATATIWPTSDATATYGGPNDLWGRTWTPADINDSTFGVAHAVDLSGISVLPTARFDNVTMNVNFSTPLPISLIYFTGSRVEDGILFKWSTASETNNDRFEIERLVNNEWVSIDDISGAGNSQSVLNYDFFMRNNDQEQGFFRLKQIDFDGEFSVSSVIRVPGKGSLNELRAHRNVSGQMVVTSNLAFSEIELYDLSGQRVAFNRVAAGTKYFTQKLPAHKQAYFLRVVEVTGKQHVIRVSL